MMHTYQRERNYYFDKGDYAEAWIVSPLQKKYLIQLGYESIINSMLGWPSLGPPWSSDTFHVFV